MKTTKPPVLLAALLLYSISPTTYQHIERKAILAFFATYDRITDSSRNPMLMIMVRQNQTVRDMEDKSSPTSCADGGRDYSLPRYRNDDFYGGWSA